MNCHIINTIEEMLLVYEKQRRSEFYPGIQFNEVTKITGVNVIKGYHRANNRTLLRASVFDSIRHLIQKKAFYYNDKKYYYFLSNESMKILERQSKIDNLLQSQ